MLITAFISEALDEIEDEGIKSALSNYIDNWISSFFMNKQLKINQRFLYSYTLSIQ